MPPCEHCGQDTYRSEGGRPRCISCSARHRVRVAELEAQLVKARLDLRIAMQEVERLTAAYVAAPHPSDDGDLAIRQARRIYERAHLKVSEALAAYQEAAGG